MTPGWESHGAWLSVRCVVAPKLVALSWIHRSGSLPQGITALPQLLNTGVFLVMPAGVFVPQLTLMCLMLNTMTARLSMPKLMPFPLVIILHVEVVHST